MLLQFFAQANNKNRMPFEFTVFHDTDVKGVEIRAGGQSGFLVCDDEEIEHWKAIAEMRMGLRETRQAN